MLGRVVLVCGTAVARRCHGLVPWWLTLVATSAQASAPMPRPGAVVAHAGCSASELQKPTGATTAPGRGIPALDGTPVETNGSHHGTRPWHPGARRYPRRNQREPPRHQAVASQPTVDHPN